MFVKCYHLKRSGFLIFNFSVIISIYASISAISVRLRLCVLSVFLQINEHNYILHIKSLSIIPSGAILKKCYSIAALLKT